MLANILSAGDGSGRYIYITAYDDQASKTTYDYYASTTGSGGIKVKITTVASGQATTVLAGMNAYYVLKMSTDDTNFHTVQFSGAGGGHRRDPSIHRC